MKIPEILAPVGDMEMCRAAVFNGADAIYVGMPGFNARGRAPTLTLEELREIIDFCHLHGVKVCIAFNVLLFEREIADAAALLEEVIPLRPDAFIVQDIGLVRLIKHLAPAQEVHASTQMTVTNAEAIAFTEDLDISRYVLGREVSIPEMSRIRAETTKELEVFVHGALCVSYSGQCLTSERNGGRSANRGQCAQSCRLPYDLIVDDEIREIAGRQYLVSPKDLCALEDVPQLKEAGIECFKIEGRLKSPEYVASTVRAYSEAVAGRQPSPTRIQDLTRIYSRGFFNGWMGGVNHQRLVDGRYGNHHGLEVGAVEEVRSDSIVVSSSAAPVAGDGVVFCEFSSSTELGGNIFAVSSAGNSRYRLSFSRDFVTAQIRRGMRVFLNSSPKVMERWNRTFTDRNEIERIPVDIEVFGEMGNPLTLTMSNGSSTVTVESASALLHAQRAPLTAEFVREELGALTGSPFELRKFDCKLSGELFIHHRELKQLRRDAVEKLVQLRIARAPISVRASCEVSDLLTSDRSQARAASLSQNATLSVLIRDQAQISALAGLPLEMVYLDYEFGKEYQQSLADVRALGIKCGIATTRILKPGEAGHLIQIRRLHPDAVLVRNLGAAHFFQNEGIPLIGDFSLNVTNSFTAHWLLAHGFDRLCPSYDLNHEQLTDLVSAIGGSPFEVTVHQYMPEFHMEHCVFAAFLSNGTSYRDCGRPCEKHRVALRDPSGQIHPLKADPECRNSMFHGTPQSGARMIPALRAQGVAHFRLEALYESESELRRKLEIYLSLLRGEQGAGDALQNLGIVEKYGVSEGQLFNIRTHRDRKKDRAPEIMASAPVNSAQG